VISLLHATRWRPVQALATRSLWLERASDPESIEHLFAFDEDDPESQEELKKHSHVLVRPGGTCVAAWNEAAAKCRGEVLVQLSDDWVPPDHWDRKILQRLGDLNQEKVLAISDGHRTDCLLCMAILTRKRYQSQEWMFCPEYSALFSDNEFSYRAYSDHVVVDAKDLVFEHRHPIYHPQVAVDKTYSHQNDPVRARIDRETFSRRNPGGPDFFKVRPFRGIGCDRGDLISALRSRVAQRRSAK
jgi:hypothetical protein